jgi:hypothetical protein
LAQILINIYRDPRFALEKVDSEIAIDVRKEVSGKILT